MFKNICLNKKFLINKTWKCTVPKNSWRRRRIPIFSPIIYNISIRPISKKIGDIFSVSSFNTLDYAFSSNQEIINENEPPQLPEIYQRHSILQSYQFLDKFSYYKIFRQSSWKKKHIRKCQTFFFNLFLKKKIENEKIFLF